MDGKLPSIQQSRYRIPTYYDRPAMKPSLYGWTVALYIFVGGLAPA